MTSFLTLIEREYYRFIRVAGQTVAPPVITTFLFVLIFGYSMGSRIESIAGVSYIIYIVPGLAGMSVLTNSFSNSSTSLFMARMDRSIENILVAPLSSMKIVMAFALGGVLRGMIVGIVTLATAYFLTDFHIQHFLLGALFMVALSMTFSALGIIAALVAEDWDHLATISTFFITPFTYLGGVFYSIEMLPPVWQKVSLANPMLYFIDGFRWCILGAASVGPVACFSVTLGATAAGVLAAVIMFRKGYKLIL